VEQTGVPQLRSWCHELTINTRLRVARVFLAQVKIFAESIKNHVQLVGDVTPEDRNDLREKWSSSHIAPDYDDTPVGVKARLALVRVAATDTAEIFTLDVIPGAW
jgi:hypothetical protein